MYYIVALKIVVGVLWLGLKPKNKCMKVHRVSLGSESSYISQQMDPWRINTKQQQQLPLECISLEYLTLEWTFLHDLMGSIWWLQCAFKMGWTTSQLENLFVLQIALTFSPLCICHNLYLHYKRGDATYNANQKLNTFKIFTCYFDSAPRDILSCTFMSKSYSSYFFPSVFCLRNIYVWEVSWSEWHTIKILL